MEKGFLLIDDSPDYVGVLKNIVEHLRTREQIDITQFHVNPLSDDFLDENSDPDIDKVVQGVQRKLSNFNAGLIIVDQFYSDASFNGLDVIGRLRAISKFKSCPIFLISGNREKIIRDIFNDEAKDGSTKVKELAKIINFSITKFLDKAFKDEAIELLKKRSLNEILPSKLREYENQSMLIHNFSPTYSRLTPQELADKIEENTVDSGFILEEMFELTLSHYMKIDEKLQ